MPIGKSNRFDGEVSIQQSSAEAFVKDESKAIVNDTVYQNKSAGVFPPIYSTDVTISNSGGIDSVFLMDRFGEDSVGR